MGSSTNNNNYVDYEEVMVSNDTVNYYLKRRRGGSDLVVTGKKQGLTIWSYQFVNRDLKPSKPLKCRRQVIDWLVSQSGIDQEHQQFGSKGDANIENFGTDMAAFTWLGSPWTCRKRRSHYQSIRRNGFILSVHDFVYVLAEENKRLVAYLDDIYEDYRGNKMAVVRWFHKIDEVGFVLPHIYNDREIFFSRSLQHLSIECIDGLATVLSSDHYNKFIREATRTGLAPFMCCRLFDNDDVEPFDITTVKGYWRQGILRNTASDTKVTLKRSIGDNVGCQPKKRTRCTMESEKYLKPKKVSVETNLKGGVRTCMQYLAIGSRVEILSEDSGIRGCWFMALIIKKHKDKIKVQYQDIKDAEDDTKNLEEWVLASRIAAPDVLGIRSPGRTTVRPIMSPDEGIVPFTINVGSIVDAWWHDGWWEGIVVRKESEERLHVHFPGEKQEQIFGRCNLRPSQEWYKNGWRSIKEMPELASKLSSGLEKLTKTEKSAADRKDPDVPKQVDLTKKGECVELMKCEKTTNEAECIIDLSKDGLLAQLRWKASGKRRRPRSPVNNTTSELSGVHNFERFFNLKVHTDKWNYGDSFKSSMVSPLANLVMSS